MVTLGREATKELPRAPRIKSLAPVKIAATALGSLAGLLLLALLLMVAVFPPGISISPDNGASEIRPDGDNLEITTSRWGASLSTVKVAEAKVAPDGTRTDERVLEGSVQDGKFVLANGSSPLQSDAEYKVTVTGTVKTFGLSGMEDSFVEQTHTFTTVTTPMPIVTAEGFKVKYGEELNITWNIPIASLEYKLEGVESTMRLVEDGKSAIITLAKFEQGKEYPLQITAATSNNNRDLKAPIATAVRTAPALQAVFEPADGIAGASTEAHPTITFSEPVSNPEQAQNIVTVEPQVAGTFNWPQPNRLEFVPAAPWEHLQDVTVSVASGPTLFRGISGGFVEASMQSTFTTAPFKSIDVDVTEQKMTLYENGKEVDNFLVSTGLPGTSTPLGDYTIYAKISKTDMRGPGYFAPAVPWVLVFQGDYTIHGNYWATAFGQRSSHGCVGLPVDTAKYLFDWTPMGTPVHIHE